MDSKTEWLYKNKLHAAATIINMSILSVPADKYIELFGHDLFNMAWSIISLFDKHADFLMSLDASPNDITVVTFKLVKDGITDECSAEEFQQRFNAVLNAEREAYKSTLRAFYQEEVSDGNESERA